MDVPQGRGHRVQGHSRQSGALEGVRCVSPAASTQHVPHPGQTTQPSWGGLQSINEETGAESHPR